MIDKFQAMMNSALAGRKVQVAKAELEERNGQFSAPIAELASVVNQEVDAEEKIVEGNCLTFCHF